MRSVQVPVILVIYDVRDDAARNAVARRLTSLGFTRIQRSAYVRRGTAGVARHVFRVLSRLVDAATDRLLVLTVPEQAYASAHVLGRRVIHELGGTILV